MEHTLEKGKQYKISEMAKFVNVEAHVLRYWEEELQLPIRRNELGHRYYTQEDKEIFLKVKHLKEKGIQLKGIRSMLDMAAEEDALSHSKEEISPININVSEVMPLHSGLTGAPKAVLNFNADKEEKSLRLQMLLKGLIQEAVEESNSKLAEDIKECLVKEMDYQFRVASEEQEQHRQAYMKQQEEYFQRLDEMIQSSRHSRKKKTSKWFKKNADKVEMS